MALAFHGGGNGGIVGIDDVARTQALALGQMPRLFGNLVMSLAGLAQVTGKAFTRRGTHL